MSNKLATVKRFAWCLADGILMFGPRCPNGALTISVCREGQDLKKWSASIRALCRLAYDNETYLIPGIPEASDQLEACEALVKFSETVHKVFERQAERESEGVV